MTGTMIDTRVHWQLHESCPPDWSASIESCGAGFFHSPAGLAASGAQGEPFFAELREGSGVLGIAAGVLRRCRVPPLPHHAHLPAPPALVPGALPMPLAVEALVDAARTAEWADLTIDSFESDGEIPTEAGAARLHARHEYDIPLAGTPNELLGRLSAHHRRRLRDGADWTLHTLSGGDARNLVLEVTSSAQDRASNRRGVAYDVSLPPVQAFREDPAWGLTTYAAMHRGQALSAALVGWAGKRAYYVSGGSTPEGYAHNASVWLHLQIALAFQSAGFSHYCLGGVPASAADPGDAGHGLHRFKTGFGALVRPCAGARWVLGTEHDAGHRLTRWLRDHLTRSKETA